MSEPWKCIAVERSGRAAIVTYLGTACPSHYDEWSAGVDRDFEILIRDQPGLFLVLDFEQKTILFGHLTIAPIVNLARRLSAVGGALWICGLNFPMNEAFRILRLNMIAPIAIDRSDALRQIDCAFASNPAPSPSQ